MRLVINMKRKIMSSGNAKLPKETLIWNLPAVKTCPNSTPECRKHCYALKAQKMYPNVLPFREKNLELSKSNEFMATIMNELSKVKHWYQVRIHESGDFYNQQYFNMWNVIAGLNPTKTFYAYTKNINLSLSKKFKNLILIYSDDEQNVTIKELKQKGFSGTARVTNNELHSKFETLCPGSCKDCDACYTRPNKFKRIVFKKH